MVITAKFKLLAVSIVTAVAGFGMAVPAFAQTVPGPTTDSSYNWAGYVSQGGTFTAVSGTWNVPTVSSTNSTAADAAWVGIGGVGASDLIQTGTQAIINNGQTQYQAWYETLPQTSQPLPVTINPGDSVTASITQQSPGQWLINFRDNSNNQSYQATVTYNSSEASAEWIEEMPVGNTGFIPLDNFGTVSFSNASTIENGATENLQQSNAQVMNMLNMQEQSLSTVSALGADGASFSVTRTSAAPSTGYALGSGVGGRRSRFNSNGSGGFGFQTGFRRQTNFQIPGFSGFSGFTFRSSFR